MFVRPAQSVPLQVLPPAAVHDGTHRPPWITYAGGGIGQLTTPLSLGALASTLGAVASVGGRASAGALASRVAPESIAPAASGDGCCASRRLAESVPASRPSGTSSAQPARAALTSAARRVARAPRSK